MMGFAALNPSYGLRRFVPAVARIERKRNPGQQAVRTPDFAYAQSGLRLLARFDAWDGGQMQVYEKRATLFLDLLGFHELIRSRKERHIIDALQISSRSEAMFKRDSIDFRVSAFSDSIVCSARSIAERNYIPAAYVAMYAGRLALELLTRGILVRGALTVGRLYHDDRTVFGPALIAAYEMESQHAIYPRILVIPRVSGDILMSLMIINDDMRYFSKLSPFRDDFDGWRHLDVFGPYFLAVRPTSLLLKREHAIKDLGHVTARLIRRLQKKKYKDPRVRAKYEWLRTYYNDCAARFDWPRVGVSIR